jgi:cytochrome c oxidase subunit 2
MFTGLESVSTYSDSIDTLILVITIIVGFWFFLVEGVFFWFIFKFRHKEGQKAMYITGEEPQYKKWISIPHALVILCDLVVIGMAIQVWYTVKQNLPEEDDSGKARVVRVVAQQWAWSFHHAGPDGEFDTADDISTVGELHVEVDKLYHYQLSSRDVLHSFSVPVFRLKQDAIPGRVITGWFRATKPSPPGGWDIQCTEMCGIGHGLMPAKIFIEMSEDHAAWMAENVDTKVAAISQ